MTTNTPAASVKLKTARSAADWEKIETDFKAGIKTANEIGAEHGISGTAVRNKAKRRGWTREISDKVRREIRYRLTAENEPKADENAIVETAAEIGAGIIRGHRGAVSKARALALKFLGELEFDDVPLLTRTKTLHNLSMTLSHLITLERQAFNLDEDDGRKEGPQIVYLDAADAAA